MEILLFNNNFQKIYSSCCKIANQYKGHVIRVIQFGAEQLRNNPHVSMSAIFVVNALFFYTMYSIVNRLDQRFFPSNPSVKTLPSGPVDGPSSEIKDKSASEPTEKPVIKPMVFEKRVFKCVVLHGLVAGGTLGLNVLLNKVLAHPLSRPVLIVTALASLTMHIFLDRLKMHRLDTEVHKVNKELEILNSKKAICEKELKDFETQKRMQEEHNKEITRRLNEREQAVEERIEELRRMEKALKEQEEALRNLFELSHGYDLETKDLIEKNRVLERENSIVKRENETLSKKKDDLEAQYNSLLESWTEKYENLRKRYQALSAARDENLKNLDEQAISLKQVETERDTALKAVGELEGSITKLAQEYQELAKLFEGTVHERDEEIKRLHGEVESLKLNEEDSREQKNRLDFENKQMRLEKEVLEKIVENSSKETANLSTEKDTSTEGNNVLIEENKALREQMEYLYRNNEGLETENKQLQELFNDRLEGMQKENEDLNTRLECSMKEKADLKQELQDSLEQLARLEKEIHGNLDTNNSPKKGKVPHQTL